MAKTQTIGDLLKDAANPVRALRARPPGDARSRSRLRPEFTNWLTEQASWRDGVALLDQSEHMTDVFVSGPDARRLFDHLTIQSFGRFVPGMAKQFIAVNEEGFLVGDGILIYLDDDSFDLVVDPAVGAWVRYHAEKGGFDVAIRVNEPNHWFVPLRLDPPELYRFEVQGPLALDVIEAVVGGRVPDTKLFHLTEFVIAGHRVRAIRHGMAGQPGFELFGPYAEGEDVRQAILAAGEEYGLSQIGYTAYFTTSVESGWFVVGLPAVFSSESTREFRDRIPVAATGPIGGSFDSEDIEDYYVTPFDLGYDAFIDYSKDFVGRDALERLRDDPDRRDKRKVSLIWDEDDFAGLQRAQLQPESGLPPQNRTLHDVSYTVTPFDAVRDGDVVVGYAVQSAYIAADRRFVSLGVVDADHAEPGTELTLLWGDSLAIPRAEVEPHRQVPVRVTVAPAPFSDYARTVYRK